MPEPGSNGSHRHLRRCIHRREKVHTSAPCRILQYDRVAAHVRVKSRPIRHFRRIPARPPREPRRQMPRPVVVEPRLFVPLFPRIPIPLPADLRATPPRRIRRRPVGMVLLIPNHQPALIHLQRSRPQVIVELKPHPRHRREHPDGIHIHRLRLHQHDPPRPIHPVERLSLQQQVPVESRFRYTSHPPR